MPFGYSLADDGQTLVPDAHEQAVLTTIRQLRDARYSLRQVASELNARGLRTRSGDLWRHQYVASLLDGPAAVM